LRDARPGPTQSDKRVCFRRSNYLGIGITPALGRLRPKPVADQRDDHKHGGGPQTFVTIPCKSVQCDMRIIKLIGLFAGGLLLGAIAASWWWWHVLSSQMASKSVDIAFNAAEEVECLALLRLNEPTNVIARLEKSINIGVLTLTQWEDAASLDEKSRLARNRFLVPVKVYREIYPARDDKAANIDAAPINGFLAKVPGRNPKSVCKSGVCRLDDLRRSGVNVATNSATK
jgi:hypothetical protein